ncbi:MAG: DUF1588 domain-containing protein [Planctomycetaceae bacterium]|nr:DUF1588 domain-containing protein [Planctomycetaceae bacterium]
MIRSILQSLVLAVVAISLCVSVSRLAAQIVTRPAEESPALTTDTGTADRPPQTVAAFLHAHCRKCHNETETRGGLRVDDLATAAFDPADRQRWQNIVEMVELGEMPPPDSRQPVAEQRTAFTTAVHGLLRSFGVARSEWEKQLPRYANRVNHEALFSGQHQGPAFTPARVWRISGAAYQRRMQDFELGNDFVVPMKNNDTGFADYSSLSADASTILTMKTNARRVATMLVKGRAKLPPRGNRKFEAVKKVFPGPKHRQIKEFLAIEGTPTRDQMTDVFVFVYELITRRQPSADQTDDWLQHVLIPNIRTAGLEQGLHGTIVSIFLSPDFLFRIELGQGPALPDGRRMLSSDELAFALSYTLHNHPVDALLKVAALGQLESRDDVEREFRRLYENPKLLRGRTAVGGKDNVWQKNKGGDQGFSRPRLVQFFQQYFGYTKAVDVFKDDTRHGGKHNPRSLVKDADWTVLHILAHDQNVLEELLTTEQFAVQRGRRSKNKGMPDAPVTYGFFSWNMAYNLEGQSIAEQGKTRTAMPTGQRVGLLTHPAWLIAHSTNFHTDPVRRGKWILGHLLGYSVPELPIAAQAQLPEWHDKTIRQRFSVVEAEECWRCHKKMNPLGNPLEAYDDFGRFRTHHLVDPKGAIVEAEYEQLNRFSPQNVREAQFQIPVDTTGELSGTGDPELDGRVTGPADLMHRLARSERVRQVFVRHLFRYFMGRNEMLSDSPTLIAMDRAYVTSGGSLKETLVALVTSDSFLTRR